jgi:hypothetical protein
MYAFFRAIGWYVILEIEFFCVSEVGLPRADGRFQTHVHSLGDMSEVDLAELLSQLEGHVDRFTNLGSGWTVLRITRCTVLIALYRPLAGSSCTETPKALVNKRALVNIIMITNDFPG